MGSSTHRTPGGSAAPDSSKAVWRLAAKQHGVVSRAQLLELGFSGQAIQHRLARGRLHRAGRGVYAVGRPEMTQRGCWMAAVLACGRGAALSNSSAAALWGIAPVSGDPIEVAIPVPHPRRVAGVCVHRRPNLRDGDVVLRDRIPTTTPVRTLLDLARRWEEARLERAVNEADRLDLISPEELFDALDAYTAVAGVARLRKLLGRHIFRLTDSELERRFLALAIKAGLPVPQTGQRLNGFRVDFFWPELGLVVETDGLRYHRTPAQQGRDRLRDQAHAAAGLTPLRFTHAQVCFDPTHVRETLASVVERLGVTSAGRRFVDWSRCS